MLSNPLLRDISDEQFIPVAPLATGALPKKQQQQQHAHSFRAGRRVSHKSVKAVNKQLDADEAQKRIQRAGRFARELASSVGRVDYHNNIRNRDSLAAQNHNHNHGISALEASSLTSHLVASTAATPGLVLGRNTAIEKQYLRLCGAADPAFVRPPYILETAFVVVMTKFFENRNSMSSTAYRYVDEQLRSIRQDYLVQGVYDHNLFFVYYFNSLISLIYSDLGQFNQCISQLRVLAKKFDIQSTDIQFHATLYALMNGLDLRELCLASSGSGGGSSACTMRFVRELKKSLDSSNFAKLFKLIKAEQINLASGVEELKWLHGLFLDFCRAPKLNSTNRDNIILRMRIFEDHWRRINESFHHLPLMTARLLHTVLPRWRARYLLLIFKSQYECDIGDIAQFLRFPDNESCLDFLRSQKVEFINDDQGLRSIDGLVIDCRKSQAKILQSSLLGSKNKAMG